MLSSQSIFHTPAALSRLAIRASSLARMMSGSGGGIMTQVQPENAVRLWHVATAKLLAKEIQWAIAALDSPASGVPSGP